jgi:hypothetical protein
MKFPLYIVPSWKYKVPLPLNNDCSNEPSYMSPFGKYILPSLKLPPFHNPSTYIFSSFRNYLPTPSISMSSLHVPS